MWVRVTVRPVAPSPPPHTMRCKNLAPVLATLAVTASAQQFPARAGKFAIPPTDGPTSVLKFGDVDGDGDLDLFDGRDGTPSLLPDRLLFNDGTGVFAEGEDGSVSSAAWRTWDAEFFDADGDGDLDLVLSGQPFVRLLLNDGTGRMTDAPANLPGCAHWNWAVEVGDVDGDGDEDILVGTDDFVFDPVPSCLMLNDGTGMFTDASSQLPGQFGHTFDVELGDFDGDGDLDIVSMERFLPSGDYVLRIAANDGTGQFTEVTATYGSPTVVASTRIELGDFDGDGDLDIVTPTDFYRNVGASPLVQQSIEFGNDLHVVDVDADGDLDVLGRLAPSPSSSRTHARLHLNDGTGSFTFDTTRILPLGPMASFASGDADGDADIDLALGAVSATGGEEEQRSRLWLRDSAAGVFVDASGALLPPPFQPHALFPSVAWTARISRGDVDGDGDLDMVVPSGPDHVVLNDGSGGFHPAIGALSEFGLLGDVDGDGDLDAVGATVHRNDGTGTFTDDGIPVVSSGSWTPLGTSQPFALQDLDGDGDLDLVNVFERPFPIAVWTSNLEMFEIWLNDGTGGFLHHVTFANSHMRSVADLRIEDMNGDGTPDIIVAGPQATFGGDPFGQTPFVPFVLFFNDGSANFTNVTTTQVPSDWFGFAFGMDTGDIDRDGDIDVVHAFPAKVLLNDGTGNLTDATDVWLGDALVDTNVVLTDIDVDGDLDLLAGPHTLLNVSGRFVQADSRRARQNQVLDAFDTDGDEDPDLVTSVRVLPNHHRQLSASLLPRPGAPYRLHVRFKPGYAIDVVRAQVYFSPLPPIVPTTVGGFRLDPTAIVALPAFDLRNVETLEFVLPASPSLIGATMSFQAIVENERGTLSVTNAVSERILGV